MHVLSFEYWDREIVLGLPVEVDVCTSKIARGAFARVCTEVDLTKPLNAGCTVGSSVEKLDFF